jgi:serine/threonine protein phosphatase 1
MLPERPLYAVGDVHGCLDKLRGAVAKIVAHAKSTPYQVVFLGDYVDRGPDSRGVVSLVRSLVTANDLQGTWRALKGNHEDLMVTALAGDDGLDMWIANGGGETLRSYRDHQQDMAEHVGWLASLPTMIETDNHVFVHAGLNPRVPLEEQPDETRLWIRGWERFDHDFGKHVVYGHTPRDRPELRAFSCGLDTGACYGGRLTVGVFDADRDAGPVDILEVP